jgi:N-acetylneuraminic acid mutarotase
MPPFPRAAVFRTGRWLRFLLGFALAVAPAAVYGVVGATRAAEGSVAPAGALAGAWRLLPPAPISPDAGLTSVWTGRQMLVFGREEARAEDGTVRVRVNVAAAYGPRTNRWRRLPSPGPTSSFLGYSSVWTGREMLVWGQGTRLAFNPRTSSWRRLPASPLLATHDGYGLVVWTGREMIGWGGGCCGDAFSDGVAYNPATNRWRRLARSPLAGSQSPIGAWTGRELVVFVGNLDPEGKPWSARLARAAAYDPATDSWRRLAPLPVPRPGASAAWDGHEVLVVGGRYGGPAQATAAFGFAFDPATNRWRRLPRMEQGRVGAAAVWSGKRLLVWGGQTEPVGAEAPGLPTHGLAYDPATNRWSTLPPAPLQGRPDPTALWTGRELLVWGGGDSSPRFTDGAAFAPAAQ